MIKWCGLAMIGVCLFFKDTSACTSRWMWRTRLGIAWHSDLEHQFGALHSLFGQWGWMIYQTRLALRSNHSMSFLAEHKCSVVRGCFCVLISDWESFGIVVKYSEVTFCVMRSRSRCRTDSLALKKSLCPSFARPALVCWIILGRCTCPNIN